jgi:predicted nucleic acid-binding Zn ribbon protein
MDDHNQKNLADAIDAYMKALRLDDKYYETKIRESWESSVGKTIAKHTTDLHLKRGTLFVHLDSAPLKQELSYHKDRLRSVINESLSKSAVLEIVLR